jgi:hypothetical protein
MRSVDPDISRRGMVVDAAVVAGVLDLPRPLCVVLADSSQLHSHRTADLL